MECDFIGVSGLIVKITKTYPKGDAQTQEWQGYVKQLKKRKVPKQIETFKVELPGVEIKTQLSVYEAFVLNIEARVKHFNPFCGPETKYKYF